MSEVQKAIIYVLWKAGKTQNMIAVQLGWPQSVISITRQTHLKWSKCNSKPKTTTRDEHQLNRILISNQFDNCGEILKAWNYDGITNSQSLTLWRLHQFRYDSRIPISKSLLTLKQKWKRLIWAQGHQNQFFDQWNQVIFSIVSRCSICFGDYSPHVWIKSYERCVKKKA